MKLIKLSEDHYVIVDESEITEWEVEFDEQGKLKLV